VRRRLDPATTILAIRVLLLAGALGAVTAAFLLTRKLPDAHGGEASVLYVCPMHPEVTSATPGDCPICRMQLEAKLRSAAPPPATGQGPVSDKSDRAPATFTLPVGAEIQTFEELGFGTMYEMAREMRAPAWTETRQIGHALLYRDEIALLDSNEEGLFFPSAHGDDSDPTGIKVARIDEAPTPWDDATALVRFRVITKAPLPLEKTGVVKFGTKVRPVRAVRASAVIRSPSGPYVLLVSKDKRTFTKRPIQIGSTLYEHAAVLSGLEVGERIATLNTFALDAERRFAGRNQP